MHPIVILLGSIGAVAAYIGFDCALMAQRANNAGRVSERNDKVMWYAFGVFIAAALAMSVADRYLDAEPADILANV